MPIGEITFETSEEGKAVQMLHVGPYATESETIRQLYTFAEENGLVINGAHHEAYLSDPRKTAAEKLKTILQYHVK